MADQGATKPCLLIASRRAALDALAPLLRGRFALVHAETLSEAERLLDERVDIAGVLSTVSFDDHRLFDLLRLVKAKYPGLPFIACRARDTELTKVSLEGVRIASGALGAAVFVDVSALADRYGDGELGAQVCGLIEMQLPRPRR
jgi:hypothetical protein